MEQRRQVSWEKTIADLKTELETVTQCHIELTRELRNEIAELRSSNFGLERKIRLLQEKTENVESLQDEINELNKEKSKMTMKLTIMKSERNVYASEISSLGHQKNEALLNCHIATENANNVIDELDEVKLSLSDEKNYREEAEMKLSELQRQYDIMEQDLNSLKQLLQDERAKYQLQISEDAEVNAKQTAEIQAHLGTIKEMKSKADKTTKSIDINQHGDATTQALQKAQARINQLRNDLDVTKAALAGKDKIAAQNKVELQEARAKIQVLETKLDKVTKNNPIASNQPNEYSVPVQGTLSQVKQLEQALIASKSSQAKKEQENQRLTEDFEQACKKVRDLEARLSSKNIEAQHSLKANSQLDGLKQEFSGKQVECKNLGASINRLQETVCEQNAKIAEQQEIILEQSTKIAEQQEIIQEQSAKIAERQESVGQLENISIKSELLQTPINNRDMESQRIKELKDRNSRRRPHLQEHYYPEINFMSTDAKVMDDTTGNNTSTAFKSEKKRRLIFGCIPSPRLHTPFSSKKKNREKKNKSPA